ncbi:MAG: hypothetical protein ACPG32_08355 [Akkermansiaceae bacterium]
MNIIAALWGAIGVSALLLSAITRLAPRAVEAFEMGMNTIQWIALVVFALFMMVGEGYRGFQKKFSPRTAARVRYLRDKPNAVRSLLAPLFCMGYFHANKKTQITAIVLTLGIIGLVILVSFCPQPWRGIIDFGVVLGLSWGLISFWIFCFQALTREKFPYSPEVPSSETS